MIAMTAAEIAEAVGGNLHNLSCGSAKITSISTDSRPLPEDGEKEECLFVALRGEHFDGHQYVGSALRNKAAFALVDQRGKDEFCSDVPEDRLILCEDTEQAFLDIAGYYRKKFQFKMVGITGSVGKTTTKEMIAQALSAQFHTLKTEGNYNNRVGLPKTLLRLDEDTETAVIEMGMNSFGEISDLTRRAKPDLAVITNIGVAHIEYLGSREGILKAKMEILDGMTSTAPLVLNFDDDLLCQYRDENRKVISYGIQNEDCDIKGSDVVEGDKETSFLIHADGKEYAAKIPTIGTYNVLNALAAFAVGREFGMEPETIVEALAHYRPSGMRQHIVERHGIRVIEDCYNAGPDSMQAAIKAFGSMKRPQHTRTRKIFVMGDMFELGDFSRQAHYEAGISAAKEDIDVIFCCGEACKAAVQGAEEASGPDGRKDIRHFDSKEEMTKALLGMIREGDALWFKASRGMKLEEVLSRLYERF